jgi:hypothetical protein
MTQNSNIQVFGAALCVFIIVTAIYLIWPSHFYPPDSIQAAMEIQTDVSGTNYYHPSGQRPYDPNYLVPNPAGTTQGINTRYFLEYPVSSLLYRIAELFGYDDYVIKPLLTFRALMGGLGALFFFLAIYELRRSLFIAALVSIGLGTAAGYWTFSTDLYQSINSVAIIALAFYVLVRLSRARPVRLRGKILLGAILALATLFNIMGVLSFLPFALALAFFNPNQKWLERLREIVILGLIYGIVILVGFFGVRLFLNNTQGQFNPFSWTDTTGSEAQDVFYVEPIRDVIRAGLGFGKSQVIVPGTIVRDFNAFRKDFDEASTGSKIAISAFYGAVWLVFAVPVGFLIARRRHLPASDRWLFIMLPIWFIIYAVFNWFWLPSDVHYWLVPLICWWTVVAVAFGHIRDTLPNRYRLAAGAVVTFVGVSFIINFTSQFFPESQDTNPWLEIAYDLSTTPSNTLFVSSEHPLAFYLAYFAHRDVVDTRIVNMQWNNDTERLQATILEQVERHRADNGTIYLYAADPKNIDALARLVGLDGEDELVVFRNYPWLTIYEADFPTD